MFRFFARILLMVLLALVVVTALPATIAAQETETPTPTPTITPTPDFRQLVPVGAILPWAGNFTPDGWRIANGECVTEENYPELYAVIGTIYGTCQSGIPPVDGFNLPDLTGRVPVGAGARGGLTTRNPGDMFGEETHTLTIAEMPSHDHPRNPNSHTDEVYIRGAAGGGSGYGASNHPVVSASITGLRGGGQAFNIIQPSLALNFIINVGTEPLDIGGGASGGYPTPMPTGTLSPEIVVYSTVVAGETSQPVAFVYSVSAGDFIIAMLLMFVIGLTVLRMFFTARQGKPQ